MDFPKDEDLQASFGPFNETFKFRTTKRPELVGAIPVTVGPGQWVGVVSVKITGAQPGDHYDIEGQIGVTNDLGHPCNVSAKFVLAQNRDISDGAYIDISEGGGPNVSGSANAATDPLFLGNRHHEVLTEIGSFVYPAGGTYKRIVLALRAVSSVAQTGETLKIDPDSSDIRVTRSRRVEPAAPPAPPVASARTDGARQDALERRLAALEAKLAAAGRALGA
ncbi:hypothetical protein [Oceanibacterium hippocampi]|uniref:Uncharacterized protein n=1 Tax=Oceanibacterium hippocampi TaxID=745714 RepID=A0A1Y5S3S7_9PROT|nr:hypothetical protein [Oceanibacterium hippocampi]SLN31711.1 hypothetical protein OCH7691_01142 [Oceanibacterium hippocampi]